MNGITLGKNIASMKALNRLDSVSTDLNSSLSRLSSGLRINSPSDDAAGLSIASTLRNEARLYSAATRNINDAISALNIMDGTLGSQTSILNRLMELAEQSANGSYSTRQRLTLDSEYQKLVQEFGRLGDSTKFNGLSLLLGSRGTSSFLTQAGISGSAWSTIRANTVDSGSYSGVIDNRSLPPIPDNYMESITTEELGEATDGRYMAVSVVDTTGRQRDLLMTFFEGAGVVFYQRVSDTGGVGASTKSGAQVDNVNDDWVMSLEPGVEPWNPAVGNGTLSIDSLTFMFDDGAADAANVTFKFEGLVFKQSQLAPSGPENALVFTGADSIERGRFALTVVRNRLETIALARGEIGAVMSRFKTSLELAGVSRENVASAESRISDVDVAAEAGELTRKTILQKSAASVLAQANLQPQIALSLLGMN